MRANAERQRALADIAQLQALKADAAEMRLAEAKRVVERATETHQEQLSNCNEVEAAWSASLGVHGTASDITLYWADGLCSAATAARDADTQLQRCQEDEKRAEDAFRRALLERDVAQGLARRARLSLFRKRDEQRLHETAERHSHKGSRS